MPDFSLLRIGLLAYSGVIGLSYLRYYVVNVPATLAVLPLYILTGLGVLFSAFGLRGRVADSSLHEGLFAVGGFGVGPLGAWAAWLGLFEKEHTAEVCSYSQAMPADTQALWACPNVVAAHYVMLILIAGLVIPILFFPGSLGRFDRRTFKARVE